MNKILLAKLLDIKLWIAAWLLQIKPVSDFITKYIFSDMGYLKWLVIVMSIDLFTGIAKVVKNDGWKSVSSKGLRDTVVKCIQYGAFLIITYVLTHYEIGGQVQMRNTEWLSKIAYQFIILVEIKSVYENIVAIDNRLDFVATTLYKVVDMLPKKFKNKSNEKTDNSSTSGS